MPEPLNYGDFDPMPKPCSYKGFFGGLCVCVQICFDCFVLCFVIGYVLQFGEVTHKRTLLLLLFLSHAQTIIYWGFQIDV